MDEQRWSSLMGSVGLSTFPCRTGHWNLHNAEMVWLIRMNQNQNHQLWYSVKAAKNGYHTLTLHWQQQQHKDQQYCKGIGSVFYLESISSPNKKWHYNKNLGSAKTSCKYNQQMGHTYSMCVHHCKKKKRRSVEVILCVSKIDFKGLLSKIQVWPQHCLWQCSWKL